MKNICIANFKGTEKLKCIIGCRLSQTDPAFSENVEIGYSHVNAAFNEETPHFHKGSDQYYIMLNGQLDLRVNNSQFHVRHGQLFGIRSGVVHQIIGGTLPIENFLIQVPGRGGDEICLPVGDQENGSLYPGNNEPVLLDIRQPFAEYPLGGCLPKNHANYSPWLDFTCVWGADPMRDWEKDQLHFHTLREEYYIVLRGRLDFAIESSTISVYEGQILGVKPTTVHKVIGGTGPVDILFVRVPGGRGDKITI